MLLYCVLFSLSLVSGKVVPDSKPQLIELNDGRKMPSFGLGTWISEHSPNITFEVAAEDVERAVEIAIDAGYRHIDTAYIYSTEEQVGKAVNRKIADGVINRDDIFITTKLWNDRHAKDDVVPTLREALARLNQSYVDLFLIHWPISEQKNSKEEIDYLNTWEGMIEARKLGLTKSIGVSNFNEAFLQRLIDKSLVTPAVLQVEINLNLQQPKLLEYCRQQNIAVMGYTPFGSVFGARKMVSSFGAPEPPPPRASDTELQHIAKKYKKTVAQIVLRYLYELGVVPIPKSVTRERIEQNIDIFDFSLEEQDKAQLRSYDKHYRTINPKWWKMSQYYPFEKE